MWNWHVSIILDLDISCCYELQEYVIQISIVRNTSIDWNNKDITIHGDGKQSRDLTYVSDAVNAFLLVARKNISLKRVINFGTGKDYTINFLAKEIRKISNSKSKIIYIEKRKAEVQRLTCDATLCKKLGWKHSIDIKKGLKLNIDWAKKNWL